MVLIAKFDLVYMMPIQVSSSFIRIWMFWEISTIRIRDYQFVTYMSLFIAFLFMARYCINKLVLTIIFKSSENKLILEKK